MDVSPSPYYAENFEAAKNFYQHAHYVAASRVPSISGLQIIDWSPEYIGVNKKVEEHMEYMNKHNKVKPVTHHCIKWKVHINVHSSIHDLSTVTSKMYKQAIH